MILTTVGIIVTTKKAYLNFTPYYIQRFCLRDKINNVGWS